MSTRAISYQHPVVLVGGSENARGRQSPKDGPGFSPNQENHADQGNQSAGYSEHSRREKTRPGDERQEGGQIKIQGRVDLGDEIDRRSDIKRLAPKKATDVIDDGAFHPLQFVWIGQASCGDHQPEYHCCHAQ